jgi:hypothetical protein
MIFSENSKNGYILEVIISIIVIILIYCLFNKKIEKYTLLDEDISIDEKNNKFLNRFKNKIMTPLISNNKIKNPSKIKNKNRILIITFDNRKDQDYIKIHNDNLDKYCKKWGFDYKFYEKCDKNVYWCKIFMVLDALNNNNKYDYVMWMDSDTYIFNMDINLADILNQYASDIFIGLDNQPIYDTINAGVFVIKNSQIGKQYLKDCISSLDPSCIKENGTLNGKWAGICYEQGIMNIMIDNKYKKYTTVLSNSILLNLNKCDNSVFIMHLYASSNNDRKKCFTSKKRFNFYQ